MKFKQHIPNIITCCNLLSGATATVFALNDSFEMAFLLIVLGAVFDFFDGMSARLLKVSSPIGKELDSLADDITFGLAPALMLYA
ncbi:MAG: CDP-alcohol phosphatidyltransferase family protein, partial [Paludibacteraceae bacterium]|nr:CDP-alcohol phosphatidyltransferase family protein [Paludibacteraceae bacterium]